MGRLRVLVDLLAGIALIAASVVVIRSSITDDTPEGTPPELAGQTVSVVGSASMGELSAPVGVVVFSDFECPFCGKFAQETQSVLTERFIKTGKVRLAFRHFPLAMHKNAQLAARAAECARPERRFWEFHDVLFSNQKTINKDELPRLGREAGLSDTWWACASGSNTGSTDLVVRDLAEANALGIVSTPTVLIGALTNDMIEVQTVIGGAKPAADFIAAIERLLK